MESSRFRPAEFLLGLEGLAILRQWWVDPAGVTTRAQEMRRILDLADSDDFLSYTYETPETDALTGYALWSETYDLPGNPIISAEERVVRPLLDEFKGRALDAACGTGRHAIYLAERGCAVVGIDQSQEMLTKARAKAPSVEFLEATIVTLPFEKGEFDAAVCALALTHFTDLRPPLDQLARVLRTDATLIVSDIHPFAVILGGQAGYRDSEKWLGFVRNHVHLHSGYLTAFHEAGLEVVNCIEGAWSEEELQVMLPPQWLDLADQSIADLPLVLAWKLRRK